MELLEKITLYDILGYTLPGGIAIYVVKGYSGTVSFSNFDIIVFVAFSYLLGILISQIAAFVTGWLIKKVPLIRKNIWESAGLKFRNVTRALKKAKILESRERITSIDDVWKHYINMYSDIQADSLYVRVHNYASAALLYKNMVVVSGICAVKFYLSNQMLEMFAAFMAITIFVVRWYRFEKKTKCYVINWYVKKYVN